MSPCNPYMRELVNQRSLKSVIILKERSLNLAMKSASSQRKPSAFIDEGWVSSVGGRKSDLLLHALWENSDPPHTNDLIDEKFLLMAGL